MHNLIKVLTLVYIFVCLKFLNKCNNAKFSKRNVFVHSFEKMFI